MNDAKVDWQAHIYGNTMHAYATPSANDPELGIQYNHTSAVRTWIMVKTFLEELFN